MEFGHGVDLTTGVGVGFGMHGAVQNVNQRAQNDEWRRARWLRDVQTRSTPSGILRAEVTSESVHHIAMKRGLATQVNPPR